MTANAARHLAHDGRLGRRIEVLFGHGDRERSHIRKLLHSLSTPDSHIGQVTLDTFSDQDDLNRQLLNRVGNALNGE